MAVSGFRPVLGALALSTAGFTLAGDNAGFCSAILRKTAGSQPARLESLTYILPGQTPEPGEANHQPPMVVNLLMQLRASCDQNNIYLRTGQASQARIMAQLRQTLARSDRAVRAQADAIERSVRNSLFQENEFRQALAQLEREVKKNEDRPGREVRLSGDLVSPERAAPARDTASERPRHRAEAPKRADQVTERADKGPRPAYQPSAAAGKQEYGGLPPSKIPAAGGVGAALPGIVREVRQFPPDEIRVWTDAEKISNDGGRKVAALSPPYLAGTGVQANAFRMLYDGTFPIRPSLTAVAIASPFSFVWRSGMDRTSLTEWKFNRRTVAVRRFAFGGTADHAAAPLMSADAHPSRIVFRLRTDDIRALAVRHTDGDGAASRESGRTRPVPFFRMAGKHLSVLSLQRIFGIGIAWLRGAAGPVQRILERRTEVSAANMVPVPIGNKALHSLNWLLPVQPAGPISTASYTNRPSLNLRATGQPIYQNEYGQEAAFSGHNRPNQWPAEHRMSPWRATPGTFPVERDRTIYFPPEFRFLPRTGARSGAGEETIPRWLSMAQTAAGAVPAEQGSLPLNNRVSGFAARLSPLYGKNVRFDGTAAVPGRNPAGGPASARPASRLFFSSVGKHFGEINLQRTLGMGTVGFREAAGPVQKILERLAEAFTANMTPVPIGNKALQSLNWLLPVQPAGPISTASYTNRSSLDSRATGQTIYQTEYGQEAAFSGHNRPNQWPAEHRMSPWRATPGTFPVERDRTIYFPPEFRFLPRTGSRSGAGGETIPRWLSMAQTAAGAVPAEQGSLPLNNRVSGFAARLSPLYGKNVRFDGTAAVPGRNPAGGPVSARPASRLFFSSAGKHFGEINLQRTLGMGTVGFREAAGPVQKIRKRLAAAFAAKMTPVPIGNKALQSLNWLLPVQPADPISTASYTNRSSLNSRATGQTIYQNEYGPETAFSKHSRPNQWSAEHRMSPWLATPGPFPAERDRTIYFPPEFRFLPRTGARSGAGGETIPRWLSMPQTAAVPGRGPVSARFAPHFLHRTLARAGEGFRLPQDGAARHALRQTGEKALWTPGINAPFRAEKAPTGAQGIPFAGGETVLRTQNAFFQAGTRAIRMGNHPLRLGVRTPQTGNGRFPAGTKGLPVDTSLMKADRNTAPGLPGLAHFASPLEPLESTLSDVPSGARGENTSRRGGPAMVFRMPAPAAGKAPPPQEQEGEAVLAAQTVGADQARAMNRAFSYSAPAVAGRVEAEPGARLEQPATAGGQLNYNRLTEELLVRIERRLRAERRKFGL